MTPTRLCVKLGWHGRVVDGPLFRRCKASESTWGVEGDDITIMLPKDDPYFWKVRKGPQPRGGAGDNSGQAGASCCCCCWGIIFLP